MSVEVLRDVVEYDPETGVFRWKITRSHARAGAVITTRDKDGYLRPRISRRGILGSHIAFALMTGKWPEKFLDHKNGIRSDDRWCNLREADATLNQHNRRRANKTNRHGFLGASPEGKRWAAFITVAYVRQRLGCFDTPEEAHAAYIAAKRIHHPGNTL